METEGNFGREQGPPSSGDLQCSAPTLLKGNLYISTSGGLGEEGFPSEIKNHHARFSTKNYEVPEKPVCTVESLYLARSQGLAQSLLQQLFFFSLTLKSCEIHRLLQLPSCKFHVRYQNDSNHRHRG